LPKLRAARQHFSYFGRQRVLARYLRESREHTRGAKVEKEKNSVVRYMRRQRILRARL